MRIRSKRNRGLTCLYVLIDFNFARLGVILHDVGKIVHPIEFSETGNKHEPEGHKLLLENGVAPELTQCCISHTQYDDIECSIEELLVHYQTIFGNHRQK